jgi:hypothetical protein
MRERGQIHKTSGHVIPFPEVFGSGGPQRKLTSGCWDQVVVMAVGVEFLSSRTKKF